MKTIQRGSLHNVRKSLNAQRCAGCGQPIFRRGRAWLVPSTKGASGHCHSSLTRGGGHTPTKSR